jgi:hypothetical protein
MILIRFICFRINIMTKSERNRVLTQEEQVEQLNVLQARFEKNMHRHKGIEWGSVQLRLKSNLDKLQIVREMEITGGEPDVVSFENKSERYVFCDCSPESPAGRRNLCYDREALDSRKEFKPADNAVDVAAAMGIDILSEEEYHELQKLGDFDAKTSSWLKTPPPIRKLGGAIFGDYRFGRVFIYHNGATSYYAARGFRGSLKV